MALLYFDGFDTYQDGTDIAKNSNFSYVSTGIVPSKIGTRFATGKYLPLGGYATALSYIMQNLTTFTIGFALRIDNGSGRYFRFYDTNTQQFSVFFRNDIHSIQIRDGNDNVLAESASGVFSALTWFFFEIKVTVGTLGTVEIRLNGSSSPVVTTVGDIQKTLNNYCDRFEVSNGDSTIGFDDFYVCDDTTGPGDFPCDSFLGDVRVATLFPNGSGANVEFNTTGTTNWQSVSYDTPQHSSNNYGNILGIQDTMTISGVGVRSTSNVFGVCIIGSYKKDDAGFRTMAQEIHSSNTYYVFPEFNLAAGTYNYYTDLTQVNPITLATWRPEEVNGLQIGYKITQ